MEIICLSGKLYSAEPHAHAHFIVVWLVFGGSNFSTNQHVNMCSISSFCLVELQVYFFTGDGLFNLVRKGLQTERFLVAIVCV